MSPHLQAALHNDFPEVIGAGQGGHGRLFIECGDGWEPIIRQAIAQISILGFPVRITMIREKYGVLRIDAVPGVGPRFNPMEHSLDEIVILAEERSSLICEICGRPGAEAVSAGGWLLTRCDEHLQTADGRLHRRTESGPAR